MGALLPASLTPPLPADAILRGRISQAGMPTELYTPGPDLHQGRRAFVSISP